MGRLVVLQAAWRKAHEAERKLARELEYKYGRTWSAPAGKQARYKVVSDKADAAQEAIFAWLDANSPRNWRAGVPCVWICESLTEADALTSERLSVTPPPSYGSYPSDAVRFAAALPKREAVHCW